MQVASLFLAFFFLANSATTLASNESIAPGATDSIYLIGQDVAGNTVLQTVPEATFRRNLRTVFQTVHDSLLPNLETHSKAQRLPTATTAESHYELRTVGIGIGLTGQIGLGPIWNISVNPRVRLIFTNSKSPVYPD